jgi:hypothetical protein
MWNQIFTSDFLTDLSVEQQELIVAGANSALDQLYKEANNVVSNLGLTPPTDNNNSTSPTPSTLPTNSNKTLVNASQNFLDKTPFKDTLMIPVL